jgi:hypothetical protein
VNRAVCHRNIQEIITYYYITAQYYSLLSQWSSNFLVRGTLETEFFLAAHPNN